MAVNLEAVLAHAIGDWLLQSQWMASNKVKSATPAVAHVAVYGLVFWLIVGPSWAALAVIVGTHYLIDRYRLARHVNWAANFIAPLRLDGPGSTGYPRWKMRHSDARRVWPRHGNYRLALHSTNPPWSECSTYGSPPGVPDHIAFIVMVTVDQILHLLCNWAALRWLG